MKKTLLVLGSEGVIGRYLVEEAKERGYWPVRCDIAISQQHDLRLPTPYVWHRIMEADLIYVLAFDVGGSAYLKKNQRTFEYIDGNLALMANVFEMLRTSEKPFIFASSQMSNMIDSPYGTLKRIGEQYTDSIGGINAKFWNVYGTETNLDKAHVITDFVRGALDGHIDVRTDGNEERQFLFGKDAATGLLALADRYDDLVRGPGVTYDITSFKWTTIKQVAAEVRKLISRDVTVHYGQNPDGTQCIKNWPNERVREFWEPTISLADGIRAVIEGTTTDAA
jgi:nucleoside-diphosphate-sugar epimerase